MTERDEINRLKLEVQRYKNLYLLYSRDELTGLQMRRDFLIKLQEMHDTGTAFYLTLVDVNGLHNVNRNEGYTAGDALIKYVVGKICNVSDGVVYRIGGDEFAILSFKENKIQNEKSFVVYSLCSKDFSSDRELFDAVDSGLIAEKEKLYNTIDNDRRICERRHCTNRKKV